MHTLLMAALLAVAGNSSKLREPRGEDTLRIMFIYGSRPAAKYKKTEPTWFGGIYGGHVGMEIGEDSVLSFRSTEYPCHFFPHRKFSSKFEIKTVYGMWETFPPHRYRIEDLKRVVFAIPVSPEQKRKVDSVAREYLRKTPYDYATAGMRCASATYDILTRAGLAHGFGGATWWRILVPKDLRQWLFEKAASREGKGWRIYKYEGTKRRIWEGDA